MDHVSVRDGNQRTQAVPEMRAQAQARQRAPRRPADQSPGSKLNCSVSPFFYLSVGLSGHNRTIDEKYIFR
jgi:hypothetical protein